MLEPLGQQGWNLPRVRSYDRVAAGCLAVFLATVILSALQDPNLAAYGVLFVLLIVGIVIGRAVERRRDAMLSAFVAGFAGLWTGYLVFVPASYVLTQAVTGERLLVAIAVGFALGFAFGLVAGAVCGTAGILAATLSRNPAVRS